ncbi:MAG: NAD-dependent epimerase/dehydratase family protein [Ruminococcus sp.]|nr:NAD-dependent epimerase/dehydratase family protein [Ruminococcus sp.]
MMKILVTGGTVFASRYTAEYFAKKGHEVWVLNRGSKPQSPNVRHICADRYSLGDTLKKHSFDAVLDVTSYNENDVRTLNEALGDFGSYVFISSSAVYPETLPQPFCEDMECGANSIWGTYGTDKLAAEKWLGSNVENAYILRPPYLYGAMNNLYREAFVLECAEEGRPFFVPKDGRMRLQFFNITDLCRFMELILEHKPEQHILNVGNPDTVSIEEWVRLCYGVLGKEPELRFVGAEVPQRSYFPFYDYEYVLDVAEMSRLMPQVTQFDTGLRESYLWFRDNRSLIVRKPLLDYIGKNLM